MLFQAYFGLHHHFDVDDKVMIFTVRRATRLQEQLVRQSVCKPRTRGQ
jgi:hypothetical protein